MSDPGFAAPTWLRNPHLMTITASIARVPPRLPLRRVRWELPDGDFMDADRLDAEDDTGRGAPAPLVLICHGLEGSSRASYVLGVMEKARACGLSSVALNFRSCSGAPNRLPRLYHSGETSDLGHAIERLLAERPGKPLALVGFSLGGNVVAKYLGERGAAVPEGVRAGAVISVPFDLAGCSDAIDGPGLAALLYRERFLRKLRPKALAKARRFPGLIDPTRVRRARLLREFDDAVTGPLHGFADAADYYARSSSGPLLAAVRRPLLLISAKNDPFVPGATLPVRVMRENPLLTPLLSASGGHVGFLDGPPWALRRWAEERTVDFIARHLG